jgi:hypothetical protein
MDGETDVTLGAAQDVSPGDDRPALDATLDTPSRSVVIGTVERDVILASQVSDTKTRVRIWVNHPTEPDKVIVGLG